MSRSVETVVLALQCFHVVFLLLHDWVPLGRLNDLRALRKTYPLRKILLGTVISSAPFIALLLFSVVDRPMPRYPLGLRVWLWVGYGWLFVGELEAWWVPYLRGTDAARVERYKVMFGETMGFLPERHGISPNTLHVVLHTCTLLLLVLFFWL